MKKKLRVLVTICMLVVISSLITTNCFANVNEKRSSKIIEDNKTKDIVEIATSDGRFKTLTTALKSADLVDALKGKGAFTVFAPTDEAFAKLTTDKVNDLLKPENKKLLQDILEYHVYSGKVLSKDVAKLNNKEITMLDGKKAKITVKGNDVFINNAKVIITDIEAKNGVIHVIDTVLIP